MGLERLFLGQQVSLQLLDLLFVAHVQGLARDALDLSIFHLSLELLILNAPITGDLVDAKMLVEVFEIRVFWQASG